MEFLSSFWWWILTLATCFVGAQLCSSYYLSEVKELEDMKARNWKAANIFGVYWFICLGISFFIFGWKSLLINLISSILIGSMVGSKMAKGIAKRYSKYTIQQWYKKNIE